MRSGQKLAETADGRQAQGALRERDQAAADGAVRLLERRCRCRACRRSPLNMGVGEAKQDTKMLDAAAEQLAQIAGQKPAVRRARKSIARFKLREGMPVGVMVTLRGERMWEMLDRLAVDRDPADPRLPRAQPALVRRSRQLHDGPARADHLPGGRLRRDRPGARPERDDHDDRRDRRRGPRAAAHARACPSAARKAARAAAEMRRQQEEADAKRAAEQEAAAAAEGRARRRTEPAETETADESRRRRAQGAAESE